MSLVPLTDTGTLLASDEAPSGQLKYTCNWSISQFSLLYSKHVKAEVLSFLQSASFSPFKDEPQCRFFLRLHPNGLDSQESHLSLHLHAEMNETVTELALSCRFLLIDRYDGEVDEQSKCTSLSTLQNPAINLFLFSFDLNADLSAHLTSERDFIGENQFILIDRLFGRGSDYLKDDKLRILCEVRHN